MRGKLFNGKMVGMLAVLLVLFMAVSVAEEEKTDISGLWKYVLEDGCATITGYMEKPEGDLLIPSELDGYAVTGIGDYAFFDCRKLAGVIIPEGVTSIGSDTFYGCVKLSGVSLPASLSSITGNSFPSNMYGEFDASFVLHDVSFEHCSVSPDNPRYEQIDGVLFDKRQKTLIAYPAARKGAYVIPEGTLYIGESAFSGCRYLTGVTIPDGVVSIGDHAFSYTGLPNVNIPDSVTNIGDHAFAVCWKLSDVTIPDGIVRIGDMAFQGCGEFANVTIPASVTSIGVNPFGALRDALWDSDGVARIDVSSDNPRYEQIDGVLFDKRQKMLISYPGARKGTYTIPEGTLCIGDNAFESCGLTGVNIPGSVTSIGDYAFFQCSGLTGVDIPAGMASIGDYAFSYCYGLTGVNIPDGVASIGEGAFDSCYVLRSVIIPASVTSIGDYAFDLCDDLLTLSVREGSIAEQYAKENGIPYVVLGSDDMGLVQGRLFARNRKCRQ